jgi:hypothetical protein
MDFDKTLTVEYMSSMGTLYGFGTGDALSKEENQTLCFSA